jgi:hypothetical protein
MDVFLISGSTSRRNKPDQARFFYVGHQFRVARSVADISNAPWGILSARYGLVWPTDQVAPYSECLSKMSSQQKRAWAYSVSASLKRVYTPTSTRVIFVGTSLYMEPLEPALHDAGFATWFPWKGKDMHGQMRALTQLRQYFKAPAVAGNV